MNRADADSAELMHALGHIYMRSGQKGRGLVFLLIANRIEPHDPGILRSLATALIENGSGERALVALDRLMNMDGHPSSHLLRARAFWVMEDKPQAYRCFREYLHLRERQ
ncbi:type III secretion protein (plasmid) [Rhizobium leguminosarum]|uniref:tetratricopeptide repeat protein n=1 Tax=Rhizobium TaxID=379 RepID=UPI00103203D5|nr:MULTISPECIES: type III secretion protein [Rhizobium]MBY5378385.1 type III secretion protein [Rhizobium leguminosarum]TBF35132.1 type III secretion protein [Rhizobium leguminosarum]TBF87968.1 type III secretion protein [Rhizobium leguminosarum]WSH48673.1 type III secretion protein [Rhizobium johnstonii]